MISISIYAHLCTKPLSCWWRTCARCFIISIMISISIIISISIMISISICSPLYKAFKLLVEDVRPVLHQTNIFCRAVHTLTILQQTNSWTKQKKHLNC